MTMAHRVSVIICTYNYANFISQCLETVTKQKPVPDEIIVVDDGSTDETEEVVRRFAEVRYIKQEHAGKAVAFNRGFSESTGNIICHLDADDYWLPEKMSRVMEVLESSSVSAIVHETISVDGMGRLLTGRRKGAEGHLEPTRLSFEEVLLSCFLYKPGRVSKKRLGIPNTVCVRREAIVDILPLPPSLGLAVDGALMLGVARCGLLYLPEKLSAYRQHGANYFVGKPESRRFEIELFQWLLRLPQAGRAREADIIKALIDENKAHFAMQTDTDVVEGAAKAARLIAKLFQMNLFPHWKHFGLPFACLFRWRRVRSLLSNAMNGAASLSSL